MRSALDPAPAKRQITAAEMVSVLRGVVSPDNGRQRLQASLALVRHEPKVSGEIAAVVPGTPTAPRVAPRPNVSRPALPRAAPPLPANRPVRAAAPGASVPPLATSPPRSITIGGATAVDPTSQTAPPGADAGTLGQAIDEILRGAPVPAVPQANVADEIAARRRADAERETLVGDPLSARPPAPPGPSLLSATLPIAAPSGAEDTRADVPTVVPPPPGTVPLLDAAAPQAHASPRTSPLVTLDTEPFPALDRTLALDARPRTPTPSDVAQVVQAPTVQAPPYVPSAAVPTTPPPGQEAPPSTSPPPTAKKRSGAAFALVLILLFVAIGAGLAGTVGYARWRKAQAPPSSAGIVATPAPKTSAIPPPIASASVPAPTAPASAVSAAPPAGSAPPPPTSTTAAPPATSVSTPSSDVPAGMGILRTTGAVPGRRIFVDERVVGQTPDSATIKCGVHQVRVGSAGKVQTVDVPCGGEITVN
jgi:hypothetical protein